MSPEERVWATLNHQEPDRVPIYEASIEIKELLQGKPPLTITPGIMFFSPETVQFLSNSGMRLPFRFVLKILQKPDLLAPIGKLAFLQASWLHRQLGIDLMGFASGLPMVFNPRIFEDFHVKNGRVLASDGRLVAHTPKGGGASARNGFLQTPADFEKYMQFDPDHPLNYFLTRNVLKAAKNKIAAYFYVPGAAMFEFLCDIFGFETFFRLLIKEPRFVEHAVKAFNDYACATVEHLAEQGAQIIYMSDDLGQINRSLISPRMYKKYFHEPIKRFMRTAHRYGLKVIRHSCGNFQEFIPLFIEEGIDAVHPWEDTAGMDIFQAKKEWGKKLTIIGNVPIEMLTRGTKRETVNYVKRLMHECAPGGGYFISSVHSVVSTCRWENYMAMLWAAKKFGRYPII
jgi:uroporphyrinogen decarboxylase